MKKIIWVLMTGIFLLGFLGGCGVRQDSEIRESMNQEIQHVEEPQMVDRDEDMDTTVEDPDRSVSSSTTEREEVSGEAEDGIAYGEEGGGEQGQSSAFSGVEIMQKEVRFVGLIDPHTIEVETEDGFMVLQVDPRFAEKLEQLPGITVMTIEYYQNEYGQYVLTNYKVD